MSKSVIAVDIDDVLAASAAGWVAYSNKQWGTSLKVEDYDEDWAKMWQMEFKLSRERANHLHNTPGILASFEPYIEALTVLQTLAEHYDLVLASSRLDHTEAETITWIDEHFKGVFNELHLAHIYQLENLTKDAHKATKADLIDKIGADYLIDDQLKHCQGVAARGKRAILFGDYAWNQTNVLPKNVTRCKDWAAVQEYFDGQR